MTSNYDKNKKVAHEAIAECISDFYFQIFHRYSKVTIAHLSKHDKKSFDVICCLYKIKQFHWLIYVVKNCDWSRKITPLSNLTRMAFRGMKLTAKAELNCKIHYLQYCRSWKNTLENLRLQSTPKAIRFEFWLKERYWRWKFVSSISYSPISLT